MEEGLEEVCESGSMLRCRNGSYDTTVIKSIGRLKTGGSRYSSGLRALFSVWVDFCAPSNV